MATLKIQTLASKDDERKALADFRNAILAVDPHSYLASLISEPLIEWFNRQVADDSYTDLLSDREHWAGQAVDWKTQAALAKERAEDTAQRMARDAEKAQAEADKAQKNAETRIAWLKSETNMAYDAARQAQERVVTMARELDAAQKELAAMKAQIKAQTLKAQAALGVLAALVVEDENTAA